MPFYFLHESIQRFSRETRGIVFRKNEKVFHVEKRILEKGSTKAITDNRSGERGIWVERFVRRADSVKREENWGIGGCRSDEWKKRGKRWFVCNRRRNGMGQRKEGLRSIYRPRKKGTREKTGNSLTGLKPALRELRGRR